jgi:cytochrome P450
MLVSSARRGLPVVEYDPYAYRVHEDPYPIYRALRDQAPAYRNEALGFWALSRHADVLAAFKDVETFSSRHGVSLDRDAFHENARATMSFLAMDPPRHTRMRALVSRGFTPRRVAELEPRIRAIAREHLEACAGRGGCDFIADFAGKLPMDVISELLGVPAADRATLREWADLVVHREEGVRELPPAAGAAALRMVQYFGGMVAERRRSPRDDLTGALLAAEIEGDRLSERDVIGFLFLMIIAGNETTTKLLGNAVYWLSRNPAERERVRRDPALIPLWVEETLRYDNSTQALARLVARDVELHGEKLRAGDKVVLLIGSANRDERAFPDPDRFDVRRNTRNSLAFGQGTHFCLGASLARLEGRVALEELERRFPGWELPASGRVRVHSVNVRGFAKLPLRLSA